jgi:hypothetical protein
VFEVTVMRRWVLAAFALVLLAGCGDEGPAGPSPSASGPSASAPASPALDPIELAQSALLSDAELPPDPPGTYVDAATGYSAVGEQVNAPWAQVLLCSTAQMSDEGALDPEPGALAGAWGFGRAGAAQVDQYAIVYVDEAAAQAAVTRARAWVEDCETWVDSWADPDLEYEVETGEVPSGVEGLTAALTLARDTSENQVSSVMRSGAVVHYLRAEEMPRVEVGQPSPGATGDTPMVDTDGMLDDAYVQQLFEAAAASVVAATS